MEREWGFPKGSDRNPFHLVLLTNNEHVIYKYTSTSAWFALKFHVYRYT